ncbi:MAG: AEC family transporter [Eubacteriales bacterium]|nr:AEC family transporter [Eubacteriales bacterium]
MISILLAKKIAEFFVYLLIGFALVKCGILKSEDSAVITKLSIYTMTPAIIIKAFQIDATGEINRGLMLAFADAVLIHVICILISSIYGKVANASEVERGSVIYSNGGNLIVPIVAAVLGEEWVIYSAAFISVFNMFIWTQGRSLFVGDEKIPWKKILLNVNIIATMIGLCMFICHIRITGIPLHVLSAFSDMLGPVSMIIVGMVLGSMKASNLFENKRIWGVLLMRLVVCPLCVLLIMWMIPTAWLPENGRQVMLVSFFAAMAPCAATINQFSILYNKDTKYASAINILSTLACIVSMPCMLYLFQIVMMK